MGRRLRSYDRAEREPVSMDREKQRGREQTKGCHGSRVTRRSSPRQLTRQGLDDDHRTGTRPRQTAAELPVCVRGARRVLRAASARVRREGERVGHCAARKGPGSGRARPRRAPLARCPWSRAGRARVVREGRVRQTGPTGQRERASEWVDGLMSGAHGTASEGERAQRRSALKGRPH
jgi:hypothetical protein